MWLSVGMVSCSSTCSGRIWSVLVGIYGLALIKVSLLFLHTCTCSSAFPGCLAGMCGLVTLELYIDGDWCNMGRFFAVVALWVGKRDLPFCVFF